MKIIAYLVLAGATLVAARAQITFCPNHCKCTAEGSSGINAVCTRLDPNEQVFMDPVQHLTVLSSHNGSFMLSDNMFARMGLQRLESVKIVNGSLHDVSVKAFHNLTSLFDVNLSDNQLFLIHPDTFANNTNLHRLKLSGNPMQLTQLLHSPHETLLRSTSLTDLDLSSCQLSQILPKTFSQLRNLVFISLSHNLLKTIPNDVFNGLEYLEELDLSYNIISKVDKNAFKVNKQISVLKLRGNPIEALSGINASSMEELDLSSCKLSILMKESIEGMPDLMTLNLSGNNIEAISSDTFMGLQELKVLDMSNNKLMGPLPSDLFVNSRELETLILSGNRELGSLVNEHGFVGNHLPMSRLELADCGLTAITTGQLSSMANLNVLNLSGNSIRRLDDLIFSRLIQLNTLDLSGNRLTTISSQLFATNNALVKLVLSGNPIKHLSAATFVSLPNLKYLYASNCSLEHLWEGHKQDGHPIVIHKSQLLPSLVMLDISDNHFKYLHLDDFNNTMVRLELIGLAGNPLECDKMNFQVIQHLENNRVDLHRDELAGGHRVVDASARWNELVDSICPVRIPKDDLQVVAKTEQRQSVPIASQQQQQPPQQQQQQQQAQRHQQPDHEQQRRPQPQLSIPVLQGAPNTFTSVDEIVVETNDSSIMWPMVLAVSILIVALYFIIYLVGEVTHRRRAIPAAYARAASLGGHVRTRGASGSPLYYKLYEECSIPAQPAKEKKSYILDFSPIHTILKKNSYKVMKSNGEANL